MRPENHQRAAVLNRPRRIGVTPSRRPFVRSQSYASESTEGVNRMPIHKDIQAYNAAQSAGDKRICDALAKAIDRHLPDAESKIWHRHPVWFLDGNPIVGYHKLKDCIRLLFWSGQSFDEPGLEAEGSFKAAEAGTPLTIRSSPRTSSGGSRSRSRSSGTTRTS